MTKQRNIGDIFYDKRDKGECHKTTIIAIDNKGRYITEAEGIDGVFVEDNLDRAEENKNDWIDEAYKEGTPTITTNDFRYFDRHEFRQAIEKYQPKSDVCNLVPIDEDVIIDIYNKVSSGKNISDILSKYGTTPQKKFTRKSIAEYLGYHGWNNPMANRYDKYEDIVLFARENGLLED